MENNSELYNFGCLSLDGAALVSGLVSLVDCGFASGFGSGLASVFESAGGVGAAGAGSAGLLPYTEYWSTGRFNLMVICVSGLLMSKSSP